ncbi:IS607 family transposase [Dubosiella newyorkensis]|uniref:IS607 family transposase n=3 Tax=Dubosiella newyorkensis TaxID=1862672 RepID=UPI00272AFD10|nr:IS607 family transposase [Dubosiella newyorkensis]
MKANEVMKILQISRSTLLRWRKDGILKANKLPSGQYDWDEDSVYALINKGEKRGVYLYARVSTPKQKHDLENQMENLQNFAMKQGYAVAGAFQDIASGISFEKRKEFFELLDLVIGGKVSTVIITYKDRLSRVGFDLFKYLFAKYHVDIVVMSELKDKKTDQQEIFEEIISLLHAFSMRMDSGRRKKIKEALADGIEEGSECDGKKTEVQQES